MAALAGGGGVLPVEVAEPRPIQLPDLYPKQREVFYSPARIVVCEASTKSGKTVGGLHWLMCAGFEAAQPESYLWLEPTYAMARDLGFERLERWLIKADPGRTVWASNKSESWVRAGKGTIRFKGSEEPDFLYGRDYVKVVMDEATRMKEAAWFAVRTMITATRGQVRIIGNVRGRKNWAHLLGVKAKGGESGMEYHHLTASDAIEAGIIDADEVAAAKRELPDAVFRELYLAEPSDEGGNPFGLDAILACCTIAPIQGVPVAYGIDLAKSVDWTVVVGLNAQGGVAYFDRFQRPWQETMDVIAATVGETPALIDSTGVGDPIVEALQRRLPGVEGFQFTQQSKQKLMEGLRLAFQQRRVSMAPGTTLVDELEQFGYEYTRTGVRYSGPEGSHDDCVCALALAVECLGRDVGGERLAVIGGGRRHEPDDGTRRIDFERPNPFASDRGWTRW